MTKSVPPGDTASPLRRPSAISALKYLESTRATCVQVSPPSVDLAMYKARSAAGTLSLKSAVMPQVAGGSLGSLAVVSIIVSRKSLANWWLPGRLLTSWLRQASKSVFAGFGDCKAGWCKGGDCPHAMSGATTHSRKWKARFHCPRPGTDQGILNRVEASPQIYCRRQDTMIMNVARQE